MMIPTIIGFSFIFLFMVVLASFLDLLPSLDKKAKDMINISTAVWLLGMAHISGLWLMFKIHDWVGNALLIFTFFLIDIMLFASFEESEHD